LFVAHVTFDGIDELAQLVVALFQHDVDVRPRRVDVDADLHETVIKRDGV
jgi:hypothetical protein